MSQVYDTLLNAYRKRIEEENKGNKVTVRQEAPVTSRPEKKSATSIIPVVKTQATKKQTQEISAIKKPSSNVGSDISGSKKNMNSMYDKAWGNIPVLKPTVKKIEQTKPQTDEEIIKEYESIPEYNWFQRGGHVDIPGAGNGWTDKGLEYNRKQKLYGQYRQAKENIAKKAMQNGGISKDTLNDFWVGKRLFENDRTGIQRQLNNEKYVKYANAKDMLEKAGVNLEDAFSIYDNDRNAEFLADVSEYADKHPVSGTALSFLTNAESNIGKSVIETGNYLKGAPIGSNETVNTLSEITPTIRGTVKDNISDAIENPLLDKAANVLYDAGTSAGDMGTSLLISGGNPDLSLGLMASGAFAGKLSEVQGKDLTPNQMMESAAASAAIEVATEKLPLDNWLKMANSAAPRTAKRVIANILSQAGAEGTEEIVSEVANALVDGAINKDKSEVMLNIQNYMSQGMTEKQATAQAYKDIALSALNAGVTGAVSGGMMAGAGTLYNGVKYPSSQSQEQIQANNDYIQKLENVNAGQNYLDSYNQNVERADTQKGIEFIAPAGLQLPSLYSESDSSVEDSIPASTGNVNTISENLPDGVHTQAQLDVISEYQSSSNPQITKWADRKRNGEKSYKYLPVANVNDSVADYVQSKLGIDIHGNTVGLNESSLNHIDKEHINNSSKSPMTNEDLARIGYVLENPDDVVITATTSKSTRMTDNTEAPTILMRKRIDGHYYIVEAITDAKTKQDVIVTAFIEKVGKESESLNNQFKGAYHVVNALDNSSPAPHVRNDHENSSSINRVPSSAENINTFSENISNNNGNLDVQGNTGENTAASKVKIDNFADLNRDLDKLVGMYKGNENTQNLYNQMKTALNEYMQTYNQEAIDRALNLAAQIDESLIGHSYTRKGSGKNSAKAQNNRMTTTYADGDFLDAVLSYAGDIRNAARNNVLSVANNGRNTGNGDAGNGNFIRYADSTAESGNKISKTRENTIENSGLASDEELLQYHAPEKFTYEEISESESMERATEKLNKYGQSYVNELLSAQNQNLSGTDIDALMMEYKRVSEQARKTGSDADWNRAQDIMKKIQVSSTRNAQALQALAKWSRNTPEGQLAQANTLIEQTIEKKYGKKRVKKAQETVDTVYEAAKTGDTAKMQSALENLKIDPNSIQQEILDTSGTQDVNRNTVIDLLKKKGVLNKNLAEALKEDTVTQRKVIDMLSQLEDMDIDSYEAQVLMARAGKILASNMKHTFGEKVQQILYNNMLGNFRTLVSRNAGGNVPVALLEQVRQLLSAPLDKLVSLKTGQRTTTGMSLGKLKAYADGFAKGFRAEVKDVNNTINAYLKEQSSTGLHTSKSGENTLLNAIKNNSSAFKGNNIATKLLNFTNDMVKHGLSVGDRPFFEATKNQAKYEINQLVKKGCNVDTQELNLDDYIEQASTLIALEAVYQGDTELSKGFQKIRNGLAEMTKGMIGTDIMSTAVVPFVKTPSNVLDMAVEYSPFGALKNLIGTATEVKSGDFNQRRFVDETSRNIVGTFLMAAVVTAFKDAFTGGYDDDKDVKAAQKASGMQEYALKLDGGAKNYDMGWIPVFGSTIESGAAFKDARDNGSSILGATGAAMAQTAQSVFDQSMLESLSNMLGSNSYNQDSGFAKQALNSIAGSYIGQLAPSLPRQIAQSTDKYERNLGTYGTSEYYKNSFINSIPGLRETLPIKYDNEGNPVLQNQGRGLGSKLIENMLSPGKLTDVNYSDLSSEAISLFDKTGEKKQFVPTANKNDIKSGDTAPTTEQFNEYKRVFGENNAIGGEALLDSDFYKKLSADDKVKYLSQMYSDMKQVAKKEVLKDYTYPQDYEKKMDMYETFGMDGLINYYDIQNTRESTGVNDTFSAIDKLNLTDREKGEYIEKLIDMSNAATAINKTYGNSGLYQWYSMRSKADADGNGNISNKEMVNQIVQSNMDYADMVNYASVLYEDSKKKTAREKAVEAISEAYPNLLYYKWMERLTKLKGGKTDEQREAEKVSKIYEKMSNIQGGHASTSGHTYDEYLERFTKLYNQRKGNSGAAASTRKHTYEEYLERFTKLYNERYGISNQPAQKHTYEEYYDRISKLYAEWQRKRYQ